MKRPSSETSGPRPPEVDARLDALVADWDLAATTRSALARLLDHFATDPRTPTSVVEPVRAVEVHVADALQGLAVAELDEARAVADLGSGAGIPGLVLAAARPGARFWLIEASGRKAEFIAATAELLGLDNVVAVHARAEGWPAGVGVHDVVTARALAPLGVLVEYAAPLLREGGVLVAYKGRRDPGEERDAQAAAAATGLAPVRVARRPPRPGADERHLLVYAKVAATPPRFPRRPGMARKRPLGAPG